MAHTEHKGHTLKIWKYLLSFFDVSTDECDLNRAKTDPFGQEETVSKH